jgi:hypothetical protein
MLGLCELDSVRGMEVKHAEKVPVEITDLFYVIPLHRLAAVAFPDYSPGNSNR